MPRRAVPPLDEKKLQELALSYVGRFATTRAKLRGDFIKQAKQKPGKVFQEARARVDSERYEAYLRASGYGRAEVTRKAAWERIGKNATEQLGLMFPTEQPTLFNVDQDKIESLKAQ